VWGKIADNREHGSPPRDNRSSIDRLGIANNLQRNPDQYHLLQDKIVGLVVFEKLRGQYQFALNYTDPTLQNRHRHSLGVSATAADIASRLGLGDSSVALAGVIAVAHDIGHPPFSHWGEIAINKRLEPYGLKFDHDMAGVELLHDDLGEDLLAHPEVLEGLLKRHWRYNANLPFGRENRDPANLPEWVHAFEVKLRKTKSSLNLDKINHIEGQIAYQADRLTFNATDIQDGLRVGRITPDHLKEHFPSAYQVYNRLLGAFFAEYREQSGVVASDERIRSIVVNTPEVHQIIFGRFAEAFREFLLQDLVEQSKNIISSKTQVNSPQTVQAQERLIVDFSPPLQTEFQRFAKFSKDALFASVTAPLEPLVDAVFEEFLKGRLHLPEEINNQFQDAESEGERTQLIAQYMARALSDEDVLDLAKTYCPDSYLKYLPRFEVVETPSLDEELAFARIGEALGVDHNRTTRLGMPTIHASELDFRPESSLPVVSSTRKYILPVPDVGETIQISYDGVRQSGETYHKGAPIFDWKGAPVSGKGVVFFNADDDQWVAAVTGKDGENRSVFIVNEVSETQSRLLDLEREKWGDPNCPTVEEIKDILQFAVELPLLNGISQDQQEVLQGRIQELIDQGADVNGFVATLPHFLISQDIIRCCSDEQIGRLDKQLQDLRAAGSMKQSVAVLDVLNNVFGGMKNIYPSDLKYVSKNLVDVPDYADSSETPYGYKCRDRAEVFRAIYVDHPFELVTRAGNSERSYSGAVVVDRGDGSVGIVQNFRAIQSYEHPDGRKLHIADLPCQKPNVAIRYETTHKVETEVETTINVIGAGISGIATAIHLIEEFRHAPLASHKLKVNFIDSGSEPAGATYNRPDANVVGMANPIGVLGIEKKEGCVHFMNKDPKRWIAEDPRLADFYSEGQGFDPSVIITHNLYGKIVKEYFLDYIQDLSRKNEPVEVRFIQDRVVSNDKMRGLVLKGGAHLNGDAVVYCVGNALPRPIHDKNSANALLDGKNGYYRLDDQAWSLGNINETDFTVVLGTANGALFGALWAVGNGYNGKFLLVSARGETPELAGRTKPYYRQILEVEKIKEELSQTNKQLTAANLRRVFMREVVTARRAGFSLHDVVDSIGEEANALWQLLSPDEQDHFAKEYLPLWNSMRYRIPDEHWAGICKLKEEGRLEISGGLKELTALKEGGFKVVITNPDGSEREVITRKLVNNTGPSKLTSEMPECIRNLISDGEARKHAGGGIDVDREFRLRDKNGNSAEKRYALGPITAGAHPESITVPAIRANAQVLARTLLEDVVLPREVEFQSHLRTLENKHTAPSRDQIARYQKEFISTGMTEDPRFPNSANTIPTCVIYGRGRKENGKRLYTIERESVHKEIISGLLKGKLPVQEDKQPAFVCVAGGMSVGMTYLQRLMMNEGVLQNDHTVVITPTGFQPLHEFAVRGHYQHPEKSPLLVEEYYDIVTQVVDVAVQNRLNILLVDQADYDKPITKLIRTAHEAGYESALLGLTMTPEAYYDASELWLHKFGRLPDHVRGIGDLKEFGQNWDLYKELFRFSTLFESQFHVGDLEKSEEDPTRREYSIRLLAHAKVDRDRGESSFNAVEAGRYADFLERSKYMNPDTKDPSSARAGFPYSRYRQLQEVVPVVETQSLRISEAPESLANPRNAVLQTRLEHFIAGDFEAKFLDLVRRTSAARRERAK
jgi:uncharacterized NAD(P)/FAD-binding protein YdhS/dGTP triphosphohydrolase